jgi:hypothetical protein
LNALRNLRCADPLHVDDTYKELELSIAVQSIHNLLVQMKGHPSAIALWRSEYVRPYDDELLDGLLASSQKALIAVKDSELHVAAKSLVEMKSGYGHWISTCYAHVVPQLRTLSRYILWVAFYPRAVSVAH